MKEKLIIKNFGPIKDIELHLGKVTVLIGEQATGKSTVAKVLAVCRYFSYLYEVDLYDDLVDGPFMKGIRAWGLDEAIKVDTFISYSCENYDVTICGEYTKVRHIVFEKEDGLRPQDTVKPHLVFIPKVAPKTVSFDKLYKEYLLVKPKRNESEYVHSSFFQNDVARVMDNPFYLPTERGLQSIFSIGKTSIANLSDSLFNQLAKMDGIARLFKKETYIEPLDVYYVNRNGHGFIRKANEDAFYSLFNAASGYQAVIPIVLTVKYYNELKKKTKTLLIEEPELDVFPVTQNKLVQYLVEKSKVHNSMLFLTTHSPYTLTSLNNLMYAYTVGKIDKKRANSVIEEKYWVNPEDVSVYMMKSNGSAENIVDEEGLIKAEKIDEVSKKLNAVFSDLMDIELDNVEGN